MASWVARSFACVCMAILWVGSGAAAFETKARAAFVLDQSTGTVLLNKQGDEPVPPASMSKLMTLFMTFEAIRDGRLQWNEKLRVSQHAMNYGGSTMFLDTTDRVTVEDLVRGVIVLSGNDASAVLAEAMAFDGSEAGFAQMMNDRAAVLGMENSSFANSNGWPNPRQRMSMRDLVTLADGIIRDFPTYYPMFAEREFEFDGRAPSNTQNRNPLLSLGIGADGLKTGHTKEAGFGLVGSAKKGDRRVIFAITGLDSAAARAEESERIVAWAFRQFAQKSFGVEGTEIAKAQVWMGEQRTVGMTIDGEPKILVPVAAADKMKTSIEYQGPIEAPITKGDKLGELVIETPGIPDTRVPLVATEDVGRGGILPRLRTAAQVILTKLNGGLAGAS